MIDSDIIENFIIKKYTEIKKYSIQNKKQSYGLVSLDSTSLGNNNRQINTETILLSVAFQKYHKKLVFDIINIANYNIVLGISWLKKYNLQIN